MKTSRVLTLSTLRKYGACSGEVTLFRNLFGERVEVTEELCLIHADNFSFNWAACRLLSDAAREDYARARDVAEAEYARAVAVAYAEYERARDAAHAAYERAVTPARAEYVRAIAEYERATSAPYAEYLRAVAVAFASAYINDEE
jgi:hypothetical protein